MTAEITGLLTLAAYCGIALAVVVREVRACSGGWRLWLLHIISRFYTPFVFRQRIAADCPLPPEQGILILANHRSPADPMLIFSAGSMTRNGRVIRPPEFLTAAEYCDLGGPLGFITRTMHVIPVARSGRDMGPVKEALRRVRDGKLVGVFPEGRINTGTGLLPGNPGIAWLALHSRAPIYPVFIHNAPQGTTMVEPFYTFCRSHVAFGEAIDLSAYYGRRINQELLDEVTEILMRRLAELGGVSYPATAPESNGEPEFERTNGARRNGDDSERRTSTQPAGREESGQ
jgi:1-acyl-sn-glycerol-3-phosphate acyltransferase